MTHGPVITQSAANTDTVVEPMSLDISAILERLPHRHPFLLVDRVIELHPGDSIRALKNVSFNEPFFAGLPSPPLMPGVLIVEALAQAAGILSIATAGMLPSGTTPFYFGGLDKARFRKPVEPGDQLLLRARLERSFKGTWRFSTTAQVGGREVASCKVMLVAPQAAP